LETPAGTYAEGAHIKGLGEAHGGPDTESNILCLCPNHHVLFDNYAISITDDFRVLGIPGDIRLHLVHEICLDYVRYHRQTYDVLAKKADPPPAD
jgi:putative restriction endonuclease